MANTSKQMDLFPQNNVEIKDKDAIFIKDGIFENIERLKKLSYEIKFKKDQHFENQQLKNV